MSLLNNKEIGMRLEAERVKTNKSRRKFAMDADIDQSHYTKIEKGALPVTDAIMDKLVDVYKVDKEFILHGRELGTIVPRETKEEVRDTKEGILRMLDKSLDAQVRNAAANDRHAAANERNTEYLGTLVAILAKQFNFDSTDGSSRTSSEKNAEQPGPFAQMEESSDKEEIHSGQKQKGKQKDTSA